jgi:hypothetical protein
MLPSALHICTWNFVFDIKREHGYGIMWRSSFTNGHIFFSKANPQIFFFNIYFREFSLLLSSRTA